MAPRRPATRKELAEKLESLRRDNVKRHNQTTARDELREKRLAKQNQRQAQIEHDRLLGAMASGLPVDKLRAERLEKLAKLIGNK
jgi:hypothetical protein